MSRTRAGCSRVTHPSAGRRQVCCHTRAAPRLACVKPAASVHPEPGSNSSLYISISLSLSGLELTSCFACLYFTSLFNELQILFLPGTVAPSGDPLFVWGLQRYAFFVSLQTFFHLFSGNFSCKSLIVLNSRMLHPAKFFMGYFTYGKGLKNRKIL